jgi:hypothetical protein
MALQITGNEFEALNSGDGRLQIRSDAPTVTVGSDTRVFPTTGALEVTGQSLQLADRVSTPGTGALVIVGHAFENIPQPGSGSVAFSSSAPTVHIAIKPPIGSLGLTGQSVERGTGLLFVGQAPSAEMTHSSTHATKAVSLTGSVPVVTISDVTNPTITPLTGALAVTGAVAGILGTVSPGTGSLAASSSVPSIGVTAIAQTSTGTLDFVADPPQGNPDRPPTVIFGVAANPGTVIRNLDAVPFASNYVICDRTGFKQKVDKHGHDMLEKDPYGNLVRPESSDKHRHPQERVRVESESLTGSPRPEPVDNERTIEDEYPNGVTAGDL